MSASLSVEPSCLDLSSLRRMLPCSARAGRIDVQVGLRSALNRYLSGLKTACPCQTGFSCLVWQREQRTCA